MELRVERLYKKQNYTIGKLYIDGLYFSDTLEDKDRGLKDEMSEAEIRSLKVYGETAIPTGRYRVELTYSPKFAGREWAKQFGGKTPELKEVKGYTGIRIHPLNTAKDSLGCIGVGKNTEVGKITQSVKYYSALMSKLVLAKENQEKIYITITGA